MPRREIHVVFQDRRWAVVRAGSSRALSLHDRKIDAVRAARAAAERDDARLVVFTLDGRPQATDDVD